MGLEGLERGGGEARLGNDQGGGVEEEAVEGWSRSQWRFCAGVFHQFAPVINLL
jgi:hypothetical protein